MTTKICNRCKAELDLTLFSYSIKLTDKRRSICKQCSRCQIKKHYELNKEKYKENQNKYRATTRPRKRELIRQYKQSKGCMICSEDNALCLDFHHINNDKENSINKLLSSNYSIDTIFKEIDKCVVLCSNCHRKVHGNFICLLNI